MPSENKTPFVSVIGLPKRTEYQRKRRKGIGRHCFIVTFEQQLDVAQVRLLFDSRNYTSM